jgi:hypothetical protein
MQSPLFSQVNRLVVILLKPCVIVSQCALFNFHAKLYGLYQETVGVYNDTHITQIFVGGGEGVASTLVRAIWKLPLLLELINIGDCALELSVAFGAAPCREASFFYGCYSSSRGTSSTP